MRAQTLGVAAIVLLTACGLEESNWGRHGYGESTLAITNSEGEEMVLRTGTAINLSTPEGLALEGNTIYGVTVVNVRTNTVVAQADLLTDNNGNLERSAVAHDIGEFDDIEEEDTLHLTMKDPLENRLVDQMIPITPHIPDFQGHGFQVDEVQPAHVYSADSSGAPVNSFVVGALPDPGEVSAPIYVAGKGFPTGRPSVDLYLVRDRDKWQGQAIPKAGDPDYIAGPIVGTLLRGELMPTKLSWLPTGKDLGPYDILVDVDRNGQYDFGFSAKDTSDGEDKVGLTIQYGAAWWRAKSATAAAKLSVDAAAKAYAAADAAATKAEGLAKGPDAQALAAQARSEANKAKAELNGAKSAASSAESALNQSLADDKTCIAQSKIADTAAQSAASHATKAAQLVSDTEQATKAYEAQMKALAAEMASKHLLVNLAYSSSSRTGGTWENTYDGSAKIYTYVNPPVQKGARHAWVNKLLIKHQSWTNFWNNPELIEKGGKGFGRIKVSHLMAHQLSGTLQKSCTNAPPMMIIDPTPLPVGQVQTFDVVFDYDRDGYYDIGRDFLDVISTRTNGNLMTAKDLAGMPDAQIFGFKISK